MEDNSSFKILSRIFKIKESKWTHLNEEENQWEENGHVVLFVWSWKVASFFFFPICSAAVRFSSLLTNCDWLVLTDGYTNQEITLGFSLDFKK